MRILLVMFCFLCFSSVINAQFDKGQWIIGGSGSFSHTNTDAGAVYDITNKTTTMSVSPGVGYFFMNRLAGGLRFGIIQNKFKGVIDARNTTPIFLYRKDESNTTGLGVSPFIRYYLLPFPRRVNILVDGSYTYSHNKQKSSSLQFSGDPNDGIPDQASSSSTKTDYNRNDWIISAGPSFLVNKHVTLELTVGYGYSKINKSNSTTDNLIAGIGFQIHLDKINKH